MKQRNTYFDALRGLAILMVVAIHTYKCGIDGFVDLANLGIRQILSCAVPLFFCMSGFFVFKKDFSNKQVIFSFWKHQIPKVYIPTLLWSLPYWGLAVLDGKSIFWNTYNLIVCGFSIYYFIAVILQYYLLLPFLHKFRNMGLGGVIISIIISFVMISVVTYYNIILDAHLPLIKYAGCCLLWLMFFVVGCTLSSTDRSYSIKIPIIILVAGFILSLFESYYYLSHYRLGYGIKPSSFLFSLGAILLLMSQKIERYYMSHKNLFTKALEYFGGLSFVMYLIHYYVISWGLPHFGILNDIWLVRWLVVVVASLFGIIIMKRIIPDKCKFYLGIYD